MSSTPEIMADALDHIARTARASRSQTRRLRWIDQRATNALAGIPHSDGDINLPKKATESRSMALQKRMAWHIALRKQAADSLLNVVNKYRAGKLSATDIDCAADVIASIMKAEADDAARQERGEVLL